jgi:hypothetical protein
MAEYPFAAHDEPVQLPPILQRAYGVAVFSTLVLAIYVAAQVVLCVFVARHQPSLKLLVEPYLLLLGLILHVQWKRVARDFRAEEYPRPWWIAAADCASFVTTFWAFFVLMEAFLREAKII